jgi:hypothetical protein
MQPRLSLRQVHWKPEIIFERDERGIDSTFSPLLSLAPFQPLGGAHLVRLFGVEPRRLRSPFRR